MRPIREILSDAIDKTINALLPEPTSCPSCSSPEYSVERKPYAMIAAAATGFSMPEIYTNDYSCSECGYKWEEL